MSATLVQYAVLGFAVVIIIMCIAGVCAPQRLIALVMSVWTARGAMSIAVLVRLALGALLILAAPGSRFPAAFQALGWLTVVVAVLIPLVGRKRLDGFVHWWSQRPLVFVRSWCLLGALFGAFLLYGVW